MRTHTLASLIWLLLTAIASLHPLHATGAVLTWNQHPDREELVFTFDTSRPPGEARQRGLTRILLPIQQEYWKTEAQPDLPDLSSSSILKSVSITPDGVFIDTRTDDFIFSSPATPDRQELILEFYRPVRSSSPQPDAADNASVPPPAANTSAPGAMPSAAAEDGAKQPAEEPAPDKATHHNGTDPDHTTDAEALAEPAPAKAGEALPESEPAEPGLSGTAALRGKIMRPGQEGEAPPSHQFRMSIDRNATLQADAVPPRPEENRNETLDTKAEEPPRETPNATAEESAAPGNATSGHADRGPAANMTTPGHVNATVAEKPTAHPKETGKNGTEIKSERRGAHEAPRDAAPPQAPGAPDNATTAVRVPEEKAAPDQPAPAASREIHADAGNATHDASNETHAAQANATDTQEITAHEASNATAPANATFDNSTAELEALAQTAQVALAQGNLQGGREAMNAMLEHPKAPAALREELLYSLAFIAMQEGRDDLEGNFTAIRDAYTAAMYANTDSRNVPEALSNLGFLHLSVGNVPEAKGHFDLLRRKYPDDPRVPMIDYHWGNHYLKQKEFSRAVEHYQYVIQNFPMSPAVKPATVGLLKAFTELGYFDKALQTVDQIEKRWPRHYLEEPAFLMAAGYAAMLSGKLERAREYFWGYVNIVPDAPDTDVAMARIGDIHMKEGKPNAAREIYHRTAEKFPDREGGLISLMRLAEEGVLDTPSMGDMAPVFDRPEINPETVYNRILEHADSPLAPVARLKLAMWRLWKKQFAESLADIRRFQQDYPGHDLMPKAREVADKALHDWIVSDLEREDFEAVTRHWADHEDLYAERELDPKIRLIVATAYMRTGQHQKALEMARPFVFGPVPRGEHSEPGMDLTLSLLVELQHWRDILDLANRVAPWNLGPDRQRQVDYAAALAYEKLNQPAKSRPLWTKLATDMGLTDTQRAYAHYFLARAAMNAGDPEQATILAQEGLELLKKEKQDIPKLKETLDLLVQAAERRGRTQDALAWSLEYDDYVTEGDKDWPAHTYRKALLFRKNGNLKQWGEHLQRLRELLPNTLFGRMAAAELEGARLQQEVEKFQ